MKNIFGVKKDSEGLDGQNYIIRRCSEDIIKEKEEYLKEFNTHKKNAYLPKWLNIIKNVCLFSFLFLFICILGAIDEVSIQDAYNNAPFLFYICGITFIIFIILFIINKVKVKKVLNSDEFIDFKSKSDFFLTKVLNDLSIPINSNEVDIFSYVYDLNKKEKEKNAYSLQMSKYFNMSMYIFKENDALCLATVNEVLSIPLNHIKEVYKINKKINAYGWNKEEPYNKGKYKEYKITANQYNVLFYKYYYSIRINDGTTDYEIIVPPYDYEYFDNIINLEVKESNE